MAAHRALEETAEELYEGAPCGYFSTSPDGTFLRVNQTFLAWSGYARDELVGKRRFQDLLSIGGRIFYETHVGPLVKMQGFAHEVQLDVVKKDGALLPVLFNTLAKIDANGLPLLMRSTVMDVSDRKSYERELVIAKKRAEAATRAKADFLSMMSHEIRTPMGAIVGIAALLQATQLTPQQQRYVRMLETSSHSLLALLNNILDFSRMEAGKAALVEQPFDLRALVYNTLYALNVRAEAKGLAMNVAIDEAVPPAVVGDSIKLGQVLTNLVSNAIKFTQAGSVDVSVRALEVRGDAVSLELAVADTGIGIPPDRLAAIFEEFTQASSDISASYGGSGLGLAISRKVLELYQSRMRVQSTPGEGSRFSFALTLPIARPASLEAAPGDAPAPANPQKSLAGIRALVVDDNEINRVVLSQMLRSWDVEVDVARNGREALQMAAERRHDVVLMDLRMPEMDGYEAARAIRDLGAAFAELPIIAVSASARLDIEERVEAAGFTSFIGKPFRAEELRELLERCGL